MSTNTNHRFLNQWREFANFSAREQRYIRQSLEVVQREKNVFSTWARDEDEQTHLRTQMKVYEDIPRIKKLIPDDFICGPEVENFMGPLIYISTFDLSRAYIERFPAYRFLYERMFGAAIRPWLPGAFCGAAASPCVEPGWRKSLLQSISEAAATAPGWSEVEPTFIPEWIEDNKCNEYK